MNMHDSQQRITRLRAAVQAARHRQGIDDETYYALLSRVCGRTIASTRELTVPEIGRVLDEINRRPTREKPLPGNGSLMRKIDRLLERISNAQGDSYGRPYAEGILRRQRGLEAGTPCPLNMASGAELTRVIASLQYAVRRAEGAFGRNPYTGA